MRYWPDWFALLARAQLGTRLEGVGYSRACATFEARLLEMASIPSFSDLLQQAEKLTADIDHGQELPRVNRNLHQIAEAGQRLLNKTKGVTDESTDVKA